MCVVPLSVCVTVSHDCVLWFYYRELKHDPVDETDQAELKAFPDNSFLKVATSWVETFRSSTSWVNVNTQDYWVLPLLVPLNFGCSVEWISHLLQTFLGDPSSNRNTWVVKLCWPTRAPRKTQTICLSFFYFFYFLVEVLLSWGVCGDTCQEAL